MAFVIGGADGIEPSLRAEADASLSFGKMVWPHMLARVMLTSNSTGPPQFWAAAHTTRLKLGKRGITCLHFAYFMMRGNHDFCQSLEFAVAPVELFPDWGKIAGLDWASMSTAFKPVGVEDCGEGLMEQAYLDTIELKPIVITSSYSLLGWNCQSFVRTDCVV